MQFVSVRIITEDVPRLAAFYELVTGIEPVWGNPVFAEIPTDSGTIAIGGVETLQFFGEDIADPAANRSAIVEFLVDDVDAEYERLQSELEAFEQEPTTMPWGNRSLLFRDPDGNLVNLFTPATPEAVQKFERFARA